MQAGACLDREDSMSLKDRLRFDAGAGAVYDGDRRYVLMRPDVLMGAVSGLDAATRARVLTQWCAAARLQGAASLRAYAESVRGDRQALVEATLAAAVDLGWGRWQLEEQPEAWRLTVHGSPFAQGCGPCEDPVCAPLAGLFGALLDILDGGPQPVPVRELQCEVQGASCCRFFASKGATEVPAA